MNKIQRYNPKENYTGSWPMYKSASGKWVPYVEYQKLQERVAGLEIELTQAYLTCQNKEHPCKNSTTAGSPETSDGFITGSLEERKHD